MKTVSKTVLITPEKAQRILENCPYAGQRNLSNVHVNFLASEMEKGSFVEGTSYHLARLNGKAFLINGQHTLNAIIKANCPITLTETETICDNQEEVAHCYANIDTGRMRGIADGLKAYNIDEKTGLTIQQLNQLGGAINLIDSGFAGKGRARVNRKELYDKMIAWSPYMSNYLNLMKGCPQEIRRPALWRTTVGVALVTLYYTPSTLGEKKAEDFWYNVFFDEGLMLDDPQKTLHRYLVLAYSHGGGYARSPGKHAQTPEQQILSISKCWNAYAENETLSHIRKSQNAKRVDLFLIGTPYDGRGRYILDSPPIV